MPHIVIIDQLKDWHDDYPSVNLVTAQDYLATPEHYRGKGMHIINLCRSYRYLKSGYYCSLLAEARRHKIIPSVRTITDLSNKTIYQLNIEDLDDLLHSILSKNKDNEAQAQLSINIFFGQSQDKELQEIARQLFDLFRSPLLTVDFKRQQRWSIKQIRPLQLTTLTPEQRLFFIQSLTDYLRSRWRNPRSKTVARYDLAILHNPEERLPPSNMGALKKFVREGKNLGLRST